MLVGDTSWDPYGESLWSILTKLTSANRYTFCELRKVFAVSGTKSPLGREVDRDLNTLDGINASPIRRRFGWDGKTIALSSTTPHVLGVGKSSKELRYCPLCWSSGFHSSAHQVLENTRCIWHGWELETGCPKCGVKIDYTINKQFALSPNRCQNGHTLLKRLPDQNGVVGLPDSGREFLQSYTQKIAMFNRFFRSDGDEQTRPVFSSPPRHEQLQLLAKRLTCREFRSETFNNSRFSPTGIRSTCFRLGPRPSRNTSKEERDIELILKLRGGNAVPDLFRRYWWHEEFQRSIQRVVRRLHETVLLNHSSCWGLSYASSTFGYSRGLSCVWRTAFSIWSIRHDDCFFASRRRIEDSHEYVAAWCDIADRFLLQSRRGWAGHRNLRAFIFLASKFTEYSLVASYLAILRRLITLAADKRMYSLDHLVDFAGDARPNCTYIARRSLASGVLSLWIDDEFGVSEKDMSRIRTRCASEHSIPDGMGKWTIY